MHDFFFARQPIFDGAKHVFGYELLFRDSLQNVYHSFSGEHATLDILSNALFNTTFKRMVGGKYGFVNFTRELLLNDVVFLFPPDEVVVEVLENVVPDEEVIQACKRLKNYRYRIALDDFLAADLNNPLARIADFVKVDFLQSNTEERSLIAETMRQRNLTLIAEKVETDADYREGLALGYRLFQGYFFSKPVIQVGRRLEPSQMACLRLLQAVFRDECDYKELDEVISGDMSLSYRMLKLANSPYFGFRSEITSIRHAITLMGYSGMRRFISVIAISTCIADRPAELAITALTRARIGEEIAPLIGLSNDAPSLFLTGLFSLLDALLDCPMEEALLELPIAQSIKSALLGDQNILHNALQAIIAYERGDWNQFRETAAVIRLQEDRFPVIYTSALGWATDLFHYA